jgi:SpoVK/Ycf46/Vps4 family AAA+-type ATPase
MNEAAMVALEEKLMSTERTSDAAPSTIKTTHFEQALSKISPSVSDKVWFFLCLLVSSAIIPEMLYILNKFIVSTPF